MGKHIKASVILLIFMTVLLCLQMPAHAAGSDDPMTVQQAVVQLRQAMESRESPVTLTVLSETELEDADAEAAFYVEIFYRAIAHTGVPTQGDYLYRHIKGLQYDGSWEQTAGGSLCTVTYTVSYRTTAEEEALVTDKVERILEQLDVYDASDYEKVRAIYDYLCENVDKTVFPTAKSYTAYGTLIGETAVCQGFASSFYRLALELGVDNRLISGTVGQTSHGWNIVNINGWYYNVDATKDAGFQPENYLYFLKSTYSGHVRDAGYDTEEFNESYPMTDWDYAVHDHVWDEGTVVNAATCVPGERLFLCTVGRCSEPKTEEIPAVWEHSWDEGAVTKAATGYAEGAICYTCTVCTGTKEESLPRNGWEWTGTVWHYHANGVLATGWKRIGGAWYFFENDGTMAERKWRKDSAGWCYLGDGGAMKVNAWIKDSVDWCYVGADGRCLTNAWARDSVGWIWLDGEGHITRKRWLYYRGAWYYLDSDGYMVTGWRLINGKWYYMDRSGVMQTGWLKWMNVWFYLDKTGAMATGSRQINGSVYYFGSDGVCLNP